MPPDNRAVGVSGEHSAVAESFSFVGGRCFGNSRWKSSFLTRHITIREDLLSRQVCSELSLLNASQVSGIATSSVNNQSSMMSILKLSED